jgi:hypothetical protein
MSTRAIGTTQPLEVARAYLAPGQFQKSSDQYMSPAMACGKVYLKSNVAGVVKNEPDWSLIKSLESFVGLQTSLAIGSVLRRTKDLASSPGVVYLAAANVPLLNRDYLAIREFEENSMYLNNCLGF